MYAGARNVGDGALIAHSFGPRFILHGSFSGQVVLIDEISCMSIDLIDALEQLRLKDVCLICQLDPVCNCLRGQKVAPYVSFRRKPPVLALERRHQIPAATLPSLGPGAFRYLHDAEGHVSGGGAGESCCLVPAPPRPL